MEKGTTKTDHVNPYSRSEVGRRTFDAHSSCSRLERSLRPNQCPPWAEPAQWAEILFLLKQGLERRSQMLEALRRLGKTLSDRIAALTPVMEDLAAATCTRCPAPCCLTAKIWFDAKDLLLLHLSSRPLPPAQTIANMSDSCRYIAPRGCRLDRRDRPWICTWYLCPTQRARLRSQGMPAHDRLQRKLKEIGAGRKELLNAFLRENTT